MWRVLGRGEVCTGFWWGNLRERDHWGDPDVGKDKAVPLQSWSGPEGSRKLRFPDFMTTAQGGGKVVSLTRRPSIPGTHFC